MVAEAPVNDSMNIRTTNINLLSYFEHTLLYHSKKIIKAGIIFAIFARMQVIIYLKISLYASKMCGVTNQLNIIR